MMRRLSDRPAARRPFGIAGLAAGLLALSACGSSPPTVMLTLDAAPPAPDAVQAGYPGRPIAVPAVHVPAPLDRAEFASEVSAGQIKVDDFAKWSAPLSVLARDALVRDLTARMPAGAVLPPGATGAAGHVTVIDVSILSLSSGGSEAAMQAAYRCLPGGTVRQELFHAPMTGAKPVDAAQAFSALLGQLADQITGAGLNCR